MTPRIDFQQTPGTAFITLCFIFTSPFVSAGGISIQYGYQGHHAGSKQHQSQGYSLNSGHHQNHGAAGNVQIKNRSHHNFSSHSRNRHHNNHLYSSPRYRGYTSPGNRYYNQQYSHIYLDSRFPNSYRNQSYYQRTPARSYLNHNNYAVNAWEALLQGQIRIALSQFGAEAQSYPKAGLPKLGYALSSAASGNLKQSVFAMRRAFKIDPDSLYNYHLDPRLHPIANDMIDKYQYSLKRRGRQRDAAFMVAALSYLIGDYASVYPALERAKRDGDRSRSLKNLREFID